MSYFVMKSVSFLPAPLCRLACDFFNYRVTAVLTNVPGLPEARYLAGRRIDRLMFWVPTACDRAMGISILSYAGDLSVCFFSDAHAVPDLEVVVAGYEAELAALRACGEGEPAP